MLDPSSNSLVHGESLEIQDNHRWENLSNGEWSAPAGFELARENIKSRIEEKDLITNVKNVVFDLGVMKSLCFLFVEQRVLVGLITKPNRPCALVRLGDDKPSRTQACKAYTR
ncbi:hypothetical protein Tco_0009944 [Tanacetum coccineum]